MQPGDPAGLHLPRDCPEDAGAAGSMVQEIAPPKELIVCLHEPHWRSRGSWNASALLPWEGPITRHSAAYGLRRAFKHIVQNRGHRKATAALRCPGIFAGNPGRDPHIAPTFSIGVLRPISCRHRGGGPSSPQHSSRVTSLPWEIRKKEVTWNEQGSFLASHAPL